MINIPKSIYPITDPLSLFLSVLIPNLLSIISKYQSIILNLIYFILIPPFYSSIKYIATFLHPLFNLKYPSTINPFYFTTYYF